MPTFGLFGQDFELNEGVTTFAKMGDYPLATCSFTLNSAQKRLEAKLVGSLCRAQVILTFKAPVDISAGRVTLTADPTGDAGNRVQVRYSSGGIPADVHNPRLRRHPDRAIALSIVDPAESAFGWVKQSVRLPGPVTIIGNGNGTLVHFDVRSKRNVHRPGTPLRPAVSWQDFFQWQNGPTSDQIGPEQQLAIGGLSFGGTTYELEARPNSGALFMHGDVLDTTKDATNEYLFQYAVANGRLRITGDIENAGPRMFWSKDGQADPAVVLLRLQDEHGHPVALVSDAPDIPIAVRGGVSSPVIDEPHNSPLWEQTNAAMVIGPHDGNDRAVVSGRLRALDAATLYARFADPAVPNNSLERPIFVHNGALPLGDVPLEVHGLSRGARLERTAAADLIAHLHVTGIESIQSGHSFHHSELVLDDVAHWKLSSLAEERDIAPQPPSDGARTASTHGEVGKYQFPGKSGAGQLRLPAIDLQFALSNLAGRLNSAGMPSGSGKLLALGREHLKTELEPQFSGSDPTRFDVVSLERQRHVSGVRISPAAAQPFARVLDNLATRADAAADTGRHGPDLAAQPSLTNAARVLDAALTTSSSFSSNFIFGGEPADIENQLVAKAREAEQILGTVFRTFERAWRGNRTDPRVVQLRQDLGIPDRPATLDSAEQAIDLLNAGIEYLTRSDNVADIAEDADAVVTWLSSLTGEEFMAEWAAAPEEGFSELLEHLWSPADNDLLRRVARALSGRSNMAALAQLLFGNSDIARLLELLDKPIEGILTGVQRGLDDLWQEVVDLWATSNDELLVRLRAAYGPVLTRDIYARLLDPGNAADAALLLEVIRSDLNRTLRNLGDLATDPPEYIFRTRRFPVHRSTGSETAGALWNQAFDLCSFMSDGKFWSFFLDNGSSVLIKLSQKRSLASLLREVDAEYRSAERPNPLGVPDTIDAFIEKLDADLLATDWTGAMFINPVADISRDSVLRDLAGFDHITASYVAVGGRKPLSSATRKPSIDVWAHIFKQKDAGAELKGDPSPVEDLKMALTKFDVRIRQTQLSDANIEVELYLQDVWGRKKQPPDQGGVRKEFDKLVLHGTLEPPGKDPNAPRDLVFAAYFPSPFVIPIDLAFVKDLALSSLRVARRNGATCIEIDGTLALQNKTPNLDIKLDLGDTVLRLQDFRIQIPPLPNMKVEVGTLRKLGFDFPALSFAIPKPRAFNIFGIEMVPRGLGYVRGSDAALARLRQDYIWLRRLDVSGEQPGVFVPYIELDADFGKLPGFGLIDARGLRFRLVLALKISGGMTADAAYLGISGLDARELKIDLFRLLTLEMDQLRISPAKLIAKGEDPARHPIDAGAILAEQIKLKILNWSPVPESARFDLLFLHPTANQGSSHRKGMLAVYDANAVPDGGSSGGSQDGKFFQIFWAIVAHNLELPTKVLNYLLEKSPGNDDPVGPLKRLVHKPPESANPNSPRVELILEGVKLLDRESWLFGMSFALGPLFERCNFVLHDQHYYGIHLWAEWVEAVFGQDSIELAYIPGPTRSTDRFRTNLRIPALDMLGSMRSGEVALEWAVNWDFLVDIGFPWRTSIGYDWFRAFSVPVGVYEGKFGFYFEKRTVAVATGEKLMLSAGLGLYVGYFFGAGNSVAWVRAGIGIFAIMQGTITFRVPGPILSPAILKASIDSVEIVGVVGIFAYGEGGVDVWILSARFRVYAQASVECRILYVVGGPCSLSYAARLSAGYSASVRVGCGFCSWTFSVSGSVEMGISGQLLLS